nr:hypothetical protein Itr_chr07CG03150 [Ipomoea trifida]GMD15729.1 hypothetical protein Iba_chr07cCG2550 [Ipomoea batatas]GMD17326.1 hypothetical protein Iba_chr07dCG2500 [Ipomoea batatas]GMD18791.1 hypothetical protein Iba_chr07eCG2570 [Ipomoea batatas]
MDEFEVKCEIVIVGTSQRRYFAVGAWSANKQLDEAGAGPTFSSIFALNTKSV